MDNDTVPGGSPATGDADNARPASADMESRMTQPAGTQPAETLTQLVSERVRETGMTWRQVEERSVDPQTGYRPNKDTVWKISRGVTVKISPELVRAIAAGLNVAPARAARAAALQYTGYVATELGQGVVLHDAGAPESDMPQARTILDRWEKEERQDNPPGAG
jgi:hypothetical protein